MRRGSFQAISPAGLLIEAVTTEPDRLLIIARPTALDSACPECGRRSSQVHSRYDRVLMDLPSLGRAVYLRVHVRRFRCATFTCPRRIFGEPLADSVAPRGARRTARLEGIVHHLGIALGGRPAAALAQRLMLPVSRDTLLRVLRRLAQAPGGPVRVLGIDDFAWKRGQRYGTVVCDLERRRIIDLLPDREPATVEAWLAAHREIAVVSRDRGAGYSRKLVRSVLRGGDGDVFRCRSWMLKPHTPMLRAEWEAGCRNGAELSRRLCASGFRGGLRVVTEWATRQRRNETAGVELSRTPPPARVLSRLMTTRRDDLSKADAVTVAAIETGVPTLATARNLMERFHRMFRVRDTDALASWVTDARASLLASFGKGIVADLAAVRAALTEPWSNGQTEGQITKLKLVKRQMYGRARLDLLRARLVVTT